MIFHSVSSGLHCGQHGIFSHWESQVQKKILWAWPTLIKLKLFPVFGSWPRMVCTVSGWKGDSEGNKEPLLPSLKLLSFSSPLSYSSLILHIFFLLTERGQCAQLGTHGLFRLLHRQEDDGQTQSFGLLLYSHANHFLKVWYEFIACPSTWSKIFDQR